MLALYDPTRWEIFIVRSKVDAEGRLVSTLDQKQII